MQLNNLIVFLALFACVYSQTTYKLNGQALVSYKNYRPVCDQVTASASLDVAVAAELSTIKGSISTDATLHAHLAALANGNAGALASAFVTANANAQAQITAAGSFASAQAAVKAQAASVDTSVDVVTSASATLDKLQARAAVLLKFSATAATEIDLEVQQGFALSCQEFKAWLAAGTGAAYTAIQAKVTAGTVAASDIQTVLADLQVAANANLLDLLLTARATSNVVTALKGKLVELPRALVVDATLKAKATAVTAAEASADITLKAREFFAAKAAKVVHFWADLVAVFGADVNAAVRVTLTKRLRDLCLDELSAEVTAVSGVVITPIQASASVEINVTVTAGASVNLTAVQAKLRAIVLAFVNAHCHPYKVDVVVSSSTDISVLVRASGSVNGDPAPKSLSTDNPEASAQATFIADVRTKIAANVDTDFQTLLATVQLGIANTISAIDTALTAVANLIAAIDTAVKAAVTATLTAFAKVNVELVAAATVNFQTEAFAVVDLQARAKLAAAQLKEAYATLVLRVQQDVQELNATGQLVVRLEASLKKQLLNAMNERFGFLGGILTGCPNAGSIQVTADFNETDIDALVSANAACVQYATTYAKILSLKRQLLAAIIARKSHATVEASVKAQADVVVTKYNGISAKLNAELSANANFAVKKTNDELKAVWVDAQADFKARVAACLAVLGKGSFGGSINIDISAAASGTLKHTATCTDIDLSASVKADVEVKLAAYLPICIVQATGGDASYCQGKSKVEPTQKRAASASASQVTSDPSGSSPSGNSSGQIVLPVFLVFVAVVANLFM